MTLEPNATATPEAVIARPKKFRRFRHKGDSCRTFMGEWHLEVAGKEHPTGGASLKDEQNLALEGRPVVKWHLTPAAHRK